MCGLRLLGVLSCEVSCPSCPIAHTTPTPPTPPVLAADATQAHKDAAKRADDAYNRRVYKYSTALETNQLDLAAYTLWMDDDARAAAVSPPVLYHLSLIAYMWVTSALSVEWGCSVSVYGSSGA
jgi:hypothetical protein